VVAAFRFLRQPSRPNAARAVTKSDKTPAIGAVAFRAVKNQFRHMPIRDLFAQVI